MHESNKVVLEDEYNGEKIDRVLTHIGELVPIDECEANKLDLKSFKDNHLKENRPLVIRNALSYFNCGNAFKDWSLDYLNEKCGSNKVYVTNNLNKKSL